MRVLLIHERYQQRGGEDEVFETESRLLEDHGHEVRQHVISNDFAMGFESDVEVNLGADRHGVNEASDEWLNLRSRPPGRWHGHDHIVLPGQTSYQYVDSSQ